ncbi:MAG: hypothetical protein MHM6MM_001339 [Cercozoa sp. M6MM]
MAFIFGRGRSSPQQLVRSTHNSILLLQERRDERSIKRASEKIAQSLTAMKLMLYGDGETAPRQDQIEKLSEELFESNLLEVLLNNFVHFDFESKKEVAFIFTYLLRHAEGQQRHAVEYVLTHPQILDKLVDGYEDPLIAANCGSILRECIRHPELCEQLLNSPNFARFFTFVQKPNFDVASDAFNTFKMLLTKHTALASRFLEQNYQTVIPKYNELIQSKNYVTKRQSLKLLGEILLDRSNFNVLIMYINDPANLKIMMILLRDKSRIQVEAFHVFKVFIANPKKSRAVQAILWRNKDRLIDFLARFREGDEDEQFVEEKQILLSTLEKMGPPPPEEEEEVH